MMIFEKSENKKIGELCYHAKHKSGLTVYIFPKKHSASYAAFATKFGAVDRDFIDTDGKHVIVPDGIAHFMEHKMFENEDGHDAFEEYALYGGDANAYTSEDKTVYLFSAADKFCENLRVLIKLVTHPYFTKATVAKEQGIIGQEIKMYDDDPNWRLFFNTMDCLYVKNPVKLNVAGSVESIAQITPELLYECHRLFYNLNNMVLCISGDVDPDMISDILDETLSDASPFDAKLISAEEPADLNKEYAVQQLEVSIPLYTAAYKIDPSKVRDFKTYVAIEIAVSVAFDPSSEFYSKGYAEGLFNALSANFQTVRDNTAFIEISGAAKDPQKVFAAIKKRTEEVRREGFDPDEFERAKKTLYADAVCTFDSTDRIANTFIDYYFEGDDVLAAPDIIASVDKDFAEKCFASLADNSKACLSVIEPIKKEDAK